MLFEPGHAAVGGLENKVGGKMAVLQFLPVFIF